MTAVLAPAAMLGSMLFATIAHADGDPSLPPVLQAVPVAPDAEPSAGTEPPTSPVRAHIDAGFGLTSIGLSLGGTVVASYEIAEIGIAVECAAYFNSKCGPGFVGGLRVPLAARLDLHLLGEVGANYHHRAGDLLSSDPGATRWIRYAGGRVGTQWVLGSPEHPVRGSVGLWLFVQQDLERVVATYSYLESDWFSGQATETEATTRLGGRTEVGVRFAAGFDITP